VFTHQHRVFQAPWWPWAWPWWKCWAWSRGVAVATAPAGRSSRPGPDGSDSQCSPDRGRYTSYSLERGGQIINISKQHLKGCPMLQQMRESMLCQTLHNYFCYALCQINIKESVFWLAQMMCVWCWVTSHTLLKQTSFIIVSQIGCQYFNCRCSVVIYYEKLA